MAAGDQVINPNNHLEVYKQAQRPDALSSPYAKKYEAQMKKAEKPQSSADRIRSLIRDMGAPCCK